MVDARKKRMLIGLGLLGLLILANLWVHLGKSRVTPATAPTAGTALRPAVPGKTASATRAIGANLKSNDPLEIARAVKERLDNLPPILVVSSASMLLPDPSRNIFDWELPEPPPETASAVVVVPVASAPVAKRIEPVLSGIFIVRTRPHAFFRVGNEVCLVREGEKIGGTGYILSGILGSQAVVLNELGLESVQNLQTQLDDGVQRALSKLTGPGEPMMFPIGQPRVGPASGSREIRDRNTPP